MYKKPRGTKDIYGKKQEYSTFVKNILFDIASFYNFKKIETPIFESLDLFSRTVGETSDIFSKEIYNFEDKKGRKLALRPEGTASVIRSFVENKIYGNEQPTKFFYQGPMFRYERPQKGRQRQFTQFGVELIGAKSPIVDVEIILMANQILKTLKLKNIKLIINSLGDAKTKETYSNALGNFFKQFKDELTETSIKRLDNNPLRILDDKVDGKKPFVKDAPKIEDFYSVESKAYFEKVKTILDGLKVDYEVSDKLVRGLDYYSEVIFEFVSTSEASGTQSTIIGGGRYDDMVEQFGGPSMSGIGFALGLERLVNEVERIGTQIFNDIDVYIINTDPESVISAISLANDLRAKEIIVESNLITLNANKAFKIAKSKNSKIIIIFEKELFANGDIKIREESSTKTIKIEEVREFLCKRMGK